MAAGLTDKVLAGPRFRRIFTGVFIAADVAPHPLHRVAAALLVHPATAFASHASAARVLNVPLPAGLVDEHVSVFAAGDRRRRTGIRPHVVPAGTPVARRHDLRISAPVQNFVELADSPAARPGTSAATWTRRRRPGCACRSCSPGSRSRWSTTSYDGRQHRDDLDQWDHDLERDEWLAEAGWTRVAKVLRRRGCADVPRRLSEEWRPYFPVKR